MSNEPPVDEVELLLPWFHTGRLSEEERRRLEAATRSNPELARRLALVAEEARAMTQVCEATPAPSGRPRDALFARITAEEAAHKPRGFGRLRGWLAQGGMLPSQTALAWAVAGLALVVLVEAGVISTYVTGQRRDEVYHTASSEASAGEKLLVGFAPEAPMREIEAFLSDHQATIVDGPHSGGIYAVRFGDRPLSDEERTRLIGEVKSVALVRFVVPSR